MIAARVRLARGWSVYHDNQRLYGGDLVDVDPATAESWVTSGWADLAEPAVATR
jgi:hypothetical protein